MIDLVAENRYEIAVGVAVLAFGLVAICQWWTGQLAPPRDPQEDAPVESWGDGWLN